MPAGGRGAVCASGSRVPPSAALGLRLRLRGALLGRQLAPDIYRGGRGVGISPNLLGDERECRLLLILALDDCFDDKRRRNQDKRHGRDYARDFEHFRLIRRLDISPRIGVGIR